MLTNFEANKRVLYTLRCYSVSIGKFSERFTSRSLIESVNTSLYVLKPDMCISGREHVCFTCSSLLRLRATSVTSSTRILVLLHRPGLVDEFLMNTLLLNKTVGE